MTYKQISQGIKMLLIYLGCPTGWEHTEVKVVL